MSGKVIRFDFGRLSKATRTPQGFMKVSGFAARTGILEYKQPDGSVRRELRRPEEVFKQDSLATFEHAPVTDLHPTELINPSNVGKFQKGMVTSGGSRDGRFVKVDMLVQDESLIASLESGDREELSAGYECILDFTGGVYKGQKFDAEQKSIVVNHLAIGPRRWGRSGSEVAVHCDGGVEVRSGTDWPDDKTPNKEKKMETKTVRVDGFDYEVNAKDARHVEKAIAERDARIDSLTAELGKVKNENEGLTGERDGLKEKLDAKEGDEFRTAVRARVALERKAAILLPETKFDELDDAELRAKCVTEKGKVDIEGKSEAYVSARFDLLWETEKENNESLETAREEMKTEKTDGDAEENLTPREKMIRRNAEAWKTKPENK